MNKETYFSIWAPDRSPWARWVKPVLFSHLNAAGENCDRPETPPDINWAPAPVAQVALVIDLPGAEGVLLGVALAKCGYRPIPLYNALPLPFDDLTDSAVFRNPVPVVDVLPIISAIKRLTPQLATLQLPDNAPPAFLLDSNRSANGRAIQTEQFDNRSISFTTDFPSANFLAAQGIQRALLIQRDTLEPQSDLAQTLHRWQDAGFVLERKRIDSPEATAPFTVARPSWYGAMFQRALSSLGLRRSSTGGFGGWHPDSYAGG